MLQCQMPAYDLSEKRSLELLATAAHSEVLGWTAGGCRFEKYPK
jgi:hypothetical protein